MTTSAPCNGSGHSEAEARGSGHCKTNARHAFCWLPRRCTCRMAGLGAVHSPPLSMRVWVIGTLVVLVTPSRLTLSSQGAFSLLFLSAFCLLGLYWMFEIINKNTKKRCSGLKKHPCPRKQPLSYPSVPPPSSAPLSGLKMSPQRRDGCLRGAPGIALGIALVSWWWHHSRRHRDCSRVLTVCIQTTSLKGAQEVLWRLL